MSDRPEFVEFVDRLRALLDAEYRRGRADALQRIVAAAEEEVRPSATHNQKADGATRSNGAERPNAAHRKAPRGAPDALVRRVLTERGSRGAGATEIAESAVSEVEKMVSLSGIRFALDRGRSSGEYRNDRGLWFLVREEGEN
jgi:hypothetical protein